MTAELLFILAVPALLLTALLGAPAWRRARRRRLRARHFPADWRACLQRDWALYSRLPEALRRELEGAVQVFLDDKHFTGCGALEPTSTMRLLVAAQACLLSRAERPYPALGTILIYPSSFRAPHRMEDAAGVHHLGERVLDGESWDEGKVVLAWDEVRAGSGGADHNVVVHEFAHQLDAAWVRGVGAGLPRPPASYAEHSPVLRVEYARHCQAVAAGRPTLLDAYGAESPVEFLAVASESFLCAPGALQARHPALYAELGALYDLDPAAW